MKNILLLALACLPFTTSLFAQDAPTPKEIGEAYVEAIGGAEAWLNIQDMTMTGSSAMQGMEFPVTVTTKAGDKMRVDVDVQGKKIIQAYDGQQAWQVMPFAGINEPTAMTKEESADFADTPFLNEFINTAERGYVLEAVEGKEFEGTQTLGVRVTHPQTGSDRTYYFDPEYMVPVAMVATMKGGQMKGMEMTTLMSDYTEVEGGLIVPMFMNSQVNGQTIQTIKFKEAKFNTGVEDSVFGM